MGIKNKTLQLLQSFEEVAQNTEVSQFLTDFIEDELEQLQEFLDMDFSDDFIKNDYLSALHYKTTNIIEIMDKNHKDYLLFLDLQNEVLGLKG